MIKFSYIKTEKASIFQLIYYHLVVIPRRLRIYNEMMREDERDDDRYFIYQINVLTKQRKKIKKEIIKRIT